MSYRDAGVDIDRADRLISVFAQLAKTTRRPEVLSGVGPFAAAVRVPTGIRNPVLVSSADGVGTKLAVARLAGRHDTVGIDLVAMNANDLITTGARPLFFLDYLSAGRLASIDAADIVAGIADGCRQSAMSLVGGETAELPGFYPNGEYDLAGFCVGVAERRKMIDGSRVREGDLVVGLPSNGLHSNGYSLARKALGITTKRSLNRKVPGLEQGLADELMRPTAIYVRPVLAALTKFSVSAMAHITGGGLPGNLPRVLPKGLRATIDRSALPELPIFELIRELGDVSRREMDRTFNCGIGYCMVIRPRHADNLCAFLRRRRIAARVIGRIDAGPKTLRYAKGL